jgi:hypothetical protein
MEDSEVHTGESTHAPAAGAEEGQAKTYRLGTMGWALFFIWIGICFLARFDLGVAMLGAGIITLGMQVVRVVMQLKIEGFWVVVGLLILLGGIWDLVKPEIALVPILLIVAGMLLLLSMARGRRRGR